MSRSISKYKRSLVDYLRILVYLVAVFSFVVLALTGFYPVLVLGEHITGYLVMIHATFAPVFAGCLAVLAVMWARQCRFTPGDLPWFERLVQRLTLTEGDEARQNRNSCLGQKITFWLIIFLALPLGLSILLSMFTLFGTYWQEMLLMIHRYTAYIFTVVVVVHTVLLLRMRAK
ncbi:MAG: cytochrome b/b6 domain-containing protein [Sedimentisphaerales bacterium]|nr:cytochrome b/b6 domain-containing protein [Sedimentisphaerales bacterium]